MHLRENRTLAWIVLMMCIIISVVGMGGLHLHRERNAVLELFYEGVLSGNQRSVDEILCCAESCAQIMADEVMRYLGGDHTAAVLTVSSLALCENGSSPDARYEAYTRIRAQADVMYNSMYAMDLLDGERVNFKRAYDEFWRCDREISRHPYCENAAAYNKCISSFPANAISVLVGAEKLTTFDI